MVLEQARQPKNLVIDQRRSRRQFLKWLGGGLLGTAALGVGGYTYASTIEPGWVSIEQIELTLPRLAQPFDGFRLVQISDIHLSEALTGEQLADIAETILLLRPDLVAITGDFVDHVQGLKRSISDISEALKPLASSVQVAAVLGNHDYWTGHQAVRTMLHETGIKELPNDLIDLEREGSHLYIAGVDDYWERYARLSTVLQNIHDPDGAVVLLAHEPDYADISRQSGRIDLQISGHSHGGQVVLPFVGPPILPSYAERYPSGLYALPGMFQYTNRGLGTIPPRVRFNCRPEISSFTLRAGRTSS
jgi:predicted MPP superfamily phosphohydrolase